MRAIVTLVVFLGLTGFGACGGGNGVSVVVTVDPGFWLLRDDLPAPKAAAAGILVSALRADGRAPRRGAARTFAAAADLSARAALGTQGEGRRSMERRLLPGAPPGEGSRAERTAVALTLDPKARTLSGRAEVRLIAGAGELGSATFRLSAAGIDEVVGESTEAEYSYEGGVLSVTPKTPVPAGQAWNVTIGWHDANVESELDFTPEGGGVVLANRLGEPSTFFTYGYWYWPRLLGQASFAGLEFSVTFPSALTLVMAGERISGGDNGDGTATEQWKLSRPVSWHVPLALAEYERSVSACGGTTLEVFGIPGESIDKLPIRPGTYVPVMKRICEDFRARFGEPAFGVVRMVGVDERFTNGYAAPGLLVVPNYTLDDDGKGSFAERDFFIAHEFAHQWWGNEVFLAASQDIWLVEGTADYAAATYLEGPWGEEGALGAWLNDGAALLEYYAQGGRDHALVPDDPADMEARIYYIKGAWVLRMLEFAIGRERLWQAQRSFRETHSFLPASTGEFVAAATSAFGGDLEWFFEEWIYGTGMLSLSRSWKIEGEQVVLTVKQRKPWATAPERFFKMSVPVRLQQGSRIREETVTIDGAESVLLLANP